MTVRELKKATLLSSPTMTYTITALEERGLIVRHHNHSDRRVVTVEILDAGRALASRALDTLMAIHFGLTGLSPQTADEVTRMLSDLHPHLSVVVDDVSHLAGTAGPDHAAS